MDLKNKITAAKKSGSRVFKAKVAGIECTYRSLNRKEFRDLQRSMAEKTDKLRSSGGEVSEAKVALLKDESEERLVMLGTLVPEIETDLDIATLPAGLIPSLAELVLTASGFADDSVEPEEL